MLYLIWDATRGVEKTSMDNDVVSVETDDGHAIYMMWKIMYSKNWVGVVMFVQYYIRIKNLSTGYMHIYTLDAVYNYHKKKWCILKFSSKRDDSSSSFGISCETWAYIGFLENLV